MEGCMCGLDPDSGFVCVHWRTQFRSALTPAHRIYLTDSSRSQWCCTEQSILPVSFGVPSHCSPLLLHPSAPFWQAGCWWATSEGMVWSQDVCIHMSIGHALPRLLTEFDWQQQESTAPTALSQAHETGEKSNRQAQCWIHTWLGKVLGGGGVIANGNFYFIFFLTLLQSHPTHYNLTAQSLCNQLQIYPIHAIWGPT